MKSKFSIDKDDYQPTTVLANEYEYKGYFIRDFRQTPCECCGGTRGYQILNHDGKIIDEDFCYMGNANTQNAQEDIDSGYIKLRNKSLYGDKEVNDDIS